MATADIGDFLDKMEARARHDVQTYLTRLRLGWPVTLAVLNALFMPFSTVLLGGEVTDQDAMIGLYLVFLGLVGGWVIGGVASLTTESDLLDLRQQVRHDLLEGGMLQLILEHDPYGRLPSLRPKLIEQPVRSPRSSDGGSMQERLERFIENYRGCSQDLGLRGHRGKGSRQLLPSAVRFELAELLRPEKSEAEAEET